MLQDFCSKIYTGMHNNKIIPFTVMRAFRLCAREISNVLVPFYYKMTDAPSCDENSEIVISLTSFSKRIRYVWITLQSLLRQQIRAKKIILWLSKDEFMDINMIPKEISELQSKGVEIRFVDGNIKSYKKFKYTFEEFPDSLVFIVDDDIIYPSDMIKNSMSVFEKYHRSVIVGRYGYRISYDSHLKLKPYADWDESKKYNKIWDDDNLFFGSGGGTLLIPNWFYRDVCNEELFLKLAPNADDLWLNAQARLANRKTVLLYNDLLLPIKIKNNDRLTSSNNSQDLPLNDVQINNIRMYYLDNHGLDPFSYKTEGNYSSSEVIK